MKKELIALGAALALVGTLTACSSTPADQNKGSAGSGATGSTTGSAAGTAYPRSTRYGMNGTASGHGYTYDGPAFNIYHISPHETKDPEQFVTEVCYPVKKADA